jgi:MoCo/4Fe-4S cofactor protein with predicted Tat translocation signal
MSSNLVQIALAPAKPVAAEPTKPIPQYWRSLDHLADTPEFREWMQREFPAGASEMMDGASRRSMLKVMAASFGLAGLAACTRPEFHLSPSVRGREDYVPGTPYLFSSAFTLNGHAYGLLVQTYDGRPTKIEGNPDHPSSLGAATALAQASVLSLYDPDRSQKVLDGGKDSTWEEFETRLRGISLGDGIADFRESAVAGAIEVLESEVG